MPSADELDVGNGSRVVVTGGEPEARRRLAAWIHRQLAEHEDRHDDLAGAATSHLSAALHLGCLSATEVVSRVRDRPGSAPFVRQLCWRDFFHQLLAARPDAAWNDYRSRGDRWRSDAAGLDAWKHGQTGYPIVDADIANNNLSWQWVAATGTDTNPHRIFNPTVQAQRYDARGDYVRRYVPELALLGGGAVHEPWKLGPLERSALDYPEPIVDHHAAIAEYRARFADRSATQ